MKKVKKRNIETYGLLRNTLTLCLKIELSIFVNKHVSDVVQPPFTKMFVTSGGIPKEQKHSKLLFQRKYCVGRTNIDGFLL